MVDPWRNDPSGVWGIWYRMEFPAVDVDFDMSTHAHFDHDALGRLDANMLLDRVAGTFQLGDVKITGIADKHQCVSLPEPCREARPSSNSRAARAFSR